MLLTLLMAFVTFGAPCLSMPVNSSVTTTFIKTSSHTVVTSTSLPGGPRTLPVILSASQPHRNRLLTPVIILATSAAIFLIVAASLLISLNTRFSKLKTCHICHQRKKLRKCVTMDRCRVWAMDVRDKNRIEIGRRQNEVKVIREQNSKMSLRLEATERERNG
ncbi:hypothetical protein BJ875DRAFT_438426 [Amylocarpus encephaloides]|uniref:Uncharacterized protein n=1 Tax=Amylocarpus encephaloides TaxID=45428 RepID=A0A9P7YPJ7_9HELO|nr:hypothetical protein BJ875DRAFT_438426 [Amylocarpus encephaloides]